VPSGPVLIGEPRPSSGQAAPGDPRPRPAPGPGPTGGAAGEAVEHPSGSLAALAGAVLTVVVLLIVGALVVIVVAAAISHPSSGEDVVLTTSAPYRPGVREVAAPVAGVPVPAPMGDWTAARGQVIARRALQWLNWPYSFDAGNANGPTYGQAVDVASRNDGHVYGFDCSGLVIYALAPWHSVDHSAAAQYTEAGSFHPMLADLQPGDLVFWSKDGTINGIGHVAIYVGNGNVVEAPQSGERIKVVPLDQVEPGKLGLTRPLT
jgi:hypothetical protein